MRNLTYLMKASRPPNPLKVTATQGRPLLVVFAKILGADPDTARPYRAREEVYKSEDPADQAEDRRQALMTLGRPLIPDRVIAITKGDPAAFLDPRPKFG